MKKAPAKVRQGWVDGIDLETLKPSFDRIVRVGAALVGAAGGEVVIHTPTGVWRSRGTDLAETPVAGLVAKSETTVWIEDMTTDPRVAHLVDRLRLEDYRLYVGAPIRLADGRLLGVLTIVDPKPQPRNGRIAKRIKELADLIADDWGRHRAILDQAKAEAEAAAAKATLASITQSASMALAMTDREFRIIQASPRWYLERGLEGQDVVGRCIYDLFPGSRERWTPGFTRALGGETVRGDKVRLPLPNGRLAWIRSEHTPWRDPSGEIGGILLMSVDITDMVEALDAAKRSEQRLELALEIGGVRMWEMDLSARAYTDAGAASTVNYDRQIGYDDLANDAVWRAIHPADRPAAMELWEQHLATGEPYRTSFRMMQPDGPHRWMQSATEAIKDEAGEVVRVVGVLRDIDKEKRAELALARARDEAEAANRAKSEFLANMSHEIRTPLNGVMGVASALGRSDLTPAQREMVGLIEASAQTLESLLSDVLDLARIESGRLSLRTEPMDVARAIADVGGLFAPAAAAKGLDLVVDVDPSAHGLYLGDSARIRQVLSNLVANAVKFTASGEVRLSLSAARDAEGERLVFQVADTGIGFDGEAGARLFERFEQADGSITRRYGGTGLGLAISRSLAEAMGGRLSARSTPGEGSVFTFDAPLPRAEGRQAAGPADLDDDDEPPASSLSHMRVLLAEDHPTNRRVVELILQSAGVRLTCVENGAEAVAAWRGGAYDLVLMDMQMPVMDGLTATRAIREAEAADGRERTLIYALTANAMPEHAKASAQAGADGHLTKPITAQALFEAVADAATGTAPSARRLRA